MNTACRIASKFAAALLLVACGGTPEVRPRAALLPPAAAASAPAASSVPPSTAAAAPPVEGPAPARPGAPLSGVEGAGLGRLSPMQAVNQMLTTQALLVSLLLAPLGKDAASAPLARADDTSP